MKKAAGSLRVLWRAESLLGTLRLSALLKRSARNDARMLTEVLALEVARDESAGGQGNGLTLPALQ